MYTEREQATRMAELFFTLRQKCASKDLFFVKSLNVSFSEYNCLVQFFQTDTLGVKELAERLEITPGGVTRIITSLEDKKIVKRRIDPEDRRGINVTLTAKGDRIVNEIREASLDLHREILEHISPQHREDVMSSIEHIIDAISGWLKNREDLTVEV